MPADIDKVLGWGVDLPSFNKRSYRLAEPTQEIKAEYVAYLKRTAMEQCIESCRDLPDNQKDELRQLALRDLPKYYWGGKLWSESLNYEPSIVYLINLLLQRGEESKPKARRNEVTLELTRQMLNDKEIGPWLWGGLYMTLGMDPTMALEAGKMTLNSAEQTQKTAESKLQLIMSELQKT